MPRLQIDQKSKEEISFQFQLKNILSKYILKHVKFCQNSVGQWIPERCQMCSNDEVDKCSLLLEYKRRRECGSHGKERPRRPVCLEAHLRTEVMERIF